MKREYLFLLLLCCFCFEAISQQQVAPVSPLLEKIDARTEKIKAAINNSGTPVEYPIQDFYHKPVLASRPLRFSLLVDTTPPTDPSLLVGTTSGIASVYLQFNPSSDPESGISYYAFAIGTAAGLSDVRYWQSLGTATTTQSFSLNSLGIAEGSVFYFTVYAVNGAGLQSAYVSSSPLSMNWENYGDTTNHMTVQYAGSGYAADGVTVIAGWSPAQIAKYDHFISKMIPIIKDIYGPPSRSNMITLVRNLYYGGSNIYFPNSNEIHKDDSFHPQLLTHELLHAYRDDILLAMDANWSYHPKLSGFEESFAQGASYACMNRYVQLYPNDTVVNPASLFGSSMDWDYDFRNINNITTEDFWSDYSGMGIFWERYELGAAAMRKMHLEDSLFYKKFNIAYYDYLNTHHQATPTRSLIISLLSSVLTQVEGKPTVQWLNGQRIFDCEISPGHKIWINTQHYPWTEYLIFQNIYFYETFSNGSDWAYYDNTSQSWIYHSLNGSTGIGMLYNYNGSLLRQKNLTISGNPSGFGFERLNFSTDNDVQPWPLGDTSDYILNLTQQGLYKLKTTFNTTTDSVYRIIGSQLRNTTGVYGGILNTNGGSLYIDHDDYPLETSLSITNGAFWGLRAWASVYNPLTGGTDSKAGKVTFRYTDSSGVTYRSYRNIDWGSALGNQAFLLDVNDMEPCSTVEIFSNGIDDDCDGLKDEASPVTVNLKLYIEGFYTGSETMTTVLVNSGAGNNPSIADSVTLELHAATPPYTKLYQAKAVADSHGTASFIYPAATNNNSYYLIIKHRNALETWSKAPVLFDRSVIGYNFPED
jgi:hypothetical protein